MGLHKDPRFRAALADDDEYICSLLRDIMNSEQHLECVHSLSHDDGQRFVNVLEYVRPPFNI